MTPDGDRTSVTLTSGREPDAALGAPRCSVIIPCRNEEKYIARCLDSIIANGHPKNRLEVLVVDGLSEDGTRDIVGTYTRRYPFIRLLDNTRKITPAAMNVGLGQAKGDFIVKMDAHATYPADYIEKSVTYLLDYAADNVGGVWTIAPASNGTVARTIAHALAHSFASGNAPVKVGARGLRWTDTVAFGCYRRSVFERVGFWNEDLAGSSDLDFNRRLRAAGGRILLVPQITVNYYADGDLASFWRHNFADGVWATYVLKFRSRAFSWRHWAPLALVAAVISLTGVAVAVPAVRTFSVGIIGAYTVANLGASTHLALRHRRLGYLVIAPVVFAIRHAAHGLGALHGLLLLLVPGVHWKGRRTRVVKAKSEAR